MLTAVESVVGEPEMLLLADAGGLDLGYGKGRPSSTRLTGGEAGLVFDCRGRRPFAVPADRRQRIEKLLEWNAAMRVYPEVAATVA